MLCFHIACLVHVRKHPSSVVGHVGYSVIFGFLRILRCDDDKLVNRKTIMKNTNITGLETAEVKKQLQEGRRSKVNESEKEHVEYIKYFQQMHYMRLKLHK